MIKGVREMHNQVKEEAGKILTLARNQLSTDEKKAKGETDMNLSASTDTQTHMVLKGVFPSYPVLCTRCDNDKA